MKKSTSIVKTVIIIIMALVIALDTVFIFILSNSINAVDQRVTEQEVNDVYVATLLMDKDICSKKDYVTDVIKEYSTIITDNIIHTHLPLYKRRCRKCTRLLF